MDRGAYGQMEEGVNVGGRLERMERWTNGRIDVAMIKQKKI